MIQFSEQGVHPDEHNRIIRLLKHINWDDFHYVEHVAKHLSLRQAAVRMQCSINTVRGRLSRIEKSLQTVLFVRSHMGMQITAAGQIVLRVANEMRTLESALPVGHGNNALVREGQLRICASEGVGTFWLLQRIGELKQSLPHLAISLVCISDQERILSNDFDVAIGYSSPKSNDYVQAKLANIHMHPFASTKYVAQFGLPTSLDDVKGHRCIQQDSQGLNYQSLKMYIGTDNASKVTYFTVNSASSLYFAVANGMGIGSLPTFASALTNLLVPIAVPINLRFDLWLTYRSEARHSKPVRQAIEWLRSSFDVSRYPWFGERFVHPDQISQNSGDQFVLPIF